MALLAAFKLDGYVCRIHGPDVVGATVTVKGRTVRFDFDERSGPLLVDADGAPLARQPVSERDPFWPPFNRWMVDYRKAKGAAGV